MAIVERSSGEFGSSAALAVGALRADGSANAFGKQVAAQELGDRRRRTQALDWNAFAHTVWEMSEGYELAISGLLRKRAALMKRLGASKRNGSVAKTIVASLISGVSSSNEESEPDVSHKQQ